MKSQSSLRFYTFTNFYLSAIQHGVQSFHVLHEAFLKYPKENAIVWDDPSAERLYDWAQSHKTVIVCNGGAHEDIVNIHNLFTNIAGNLIFPMPYECFCEDQYSLGGIMTAVGCVLPEEIYDAVDYKKASAMGWSGISQDAYFFIKDSVVKNVYNIDTPEWQLISMLKSCPLAR